MLLSSDFFVTVNPHRQYSDRLKQKLIDATLRLGDIDTASQVFSSVTVHQARVRPEEIGFELTHRQHHLHIHFVLELQHGGGLSIGPARDPDGRGVQQRLQDYYSDALGVPGVHVRADLLRAQSAAKNYNRKQQTRDGGAGRLLEERRLSFGGD